MSELKDPQQETFCQHYALTLDVGKAEEIAGYSHKYGYELRKKAEIIERISEIQRMAGVRMIVDQSRVIREAAYLAYSDITDVLACRTVAELQALPENVRRALKRVKVTRTPIRRDGSLDRRAQTTTEALGAMSESDQNCQIVTNSPEFEETIEIEMHSKADMIRLLAQVTQAIKDPEDIRKMAPAFTGMAITVADPKKSQTSKKRSKDDE